MLERLSLCLVGGAIYVNDYYHASEEAIFAFEPTNIKTIEVEKLDNNTIVYKPENPSKGLIFYPGGKVEYTAYIPLMKQLASEGVMGVLVKMPFNLAVFDIDAAEGIQEQYPEIEKWYIGGHSLGGSMAAAYLEEHTDAFDGLILLGSYSTTDLTSTDLDVLSIYGSEDRVLNAEKYEEYKVNLPEEFVEIVIDGGCHAYFGAYGMQEGDGEPGITCEEQTDITVKNITEFINK
jgi:hypothetical protein